MSLTTDSRPRALVAASERDKIDRNVLIWLSQFPELPEDLQKDIVVPESHLLPDLPGMALSAITTAYVNKQYILGGYEAEYNFKIVYRIKPGKNMDMSLDANELLNRMGDWAIHNKPDLGEGIHVRKVTPTSPAELYAQYEGGDEDHQIRLKIIYEVI